MNRMERCFQDNLSGGKGSLVLYFPIGDTLFDSNLAWAGKYYENGADVLEVGLPYENPVLDGPTVKASMDRALSHTTLTEIFEEIKKIRKAYPDKVIQFMTYFGNVEKYGVVKFAEICHECDVDGVLSPNATAAQLLELDKELKKHNIINLRFSAYHLTAELTKDLKENAFGYIFQQAVDGGTGTRDTVDPKLKENIERLKAAEVKTPVFGGFGINTADHVRTVMLMGADGVIVGSAVLKHLAAGDAETYIRSLSAAMMLRHK